MVNKEYKLWIVRDWGGMLFAYFNKPIRDTVWKEWESDGVPLSIDDSLFPDLTFEDIKYLLVWRFHWSNNFCNFKE